MPPMKPEVAERTMRVGRECGVEEGGRRDLRSS